ncbi:short-chain fatty acyl-CoA regulator family protein [Streptomyces sp. LS1784]|uniref:short-chain fatty acyl-CoA regulator family protein n=1 Tax=Streptomyces sp. LS1784 TaxID=2851533 RepID=UPI0035A835D2
MHSAGLDLGDEAAATPIGLGCKVCERPPCPQRSAAAPDRPPVVDEHASTFVPTPRCPVPGTDVPERVPVDLTPRSFRQDGCWCAVQTRSRSWAMWGSRSTDAPAQHESGVFEDVGVACLARDPGDNRDVLRGPSACLRCHAHRRTVPLVVDHAHSCRGRSPGGGVERRTS